jgi:hypothetical protein
VLEKSTPTPDLSGSDGPGGEGGQPYGGNSNIDLGVDQKSLLTLDLTALDNYGAEPLTIANTQYAMAGFPDSGYAPPSLRDLVPGGYDINVSFNLVGSAGILLSDGGFGFVGNYDQQGNFYAGGGVVFGEALKVLDGALTPGVTISVIRGNPTGVGTDIDLSAGAGIAGVDLNNFSNAYGSETDITFGSGIAGLAGSYMAGYKGRLSPGR